MLAIPQFGAYVAKFGTTNFIYLAQRIVEKYLLVGTVQTRTSFSIKPCRRRFVIQSLTWAPILVPYGTASRIVQKINGNWLRYYGGVNP
jgi:hypothetical protein